MYAVDSRVNVKLKFKAMEQPVEVAVPMNALPYLDLYAERWISSDGEMVYERPRMKPAVARRARRRVMIAV